MRDVYEYSDVSSVMSIALWFNELNSYNTGSIISLMMPRDMFVYFWCKAGVGAWWGRSHSGHGFCWDIECYTRSTSQGKTDTAFLCYSNTLSARPSPPEPAGSWVSGSTCWIWSCDSCTLTTDSDDCAIGWEDGPTMEFCENSSSVKNSCFSVKLQTGGLQFFVSFWHLYILFWYFLVFFGLLPSPNALPRLTMICYICVWHGEFKKNKN